VLFPLAFATGLALPVVALSQTPTGGRPTTGSTTTTTTEPTGQAFFRDALIKDPGTSAAIRTMLQSGAGFVDPATQFGDLTGDGKADAVVRVDNGGAAGSIAAYVFSTDGGGAAAKLRVVYRTQQLYRVTARVENGALLLTVPLYAKGDEPCCPAKQVVRTYTWDPKAHTLHRTNATEIAGPGAPAPPAPPPQQ
jgi:hypothetical protein